MAAGQPVRNGMMRSAGRFSFGADPSPAYDCHAHAGRHLTLAGLLIAPGCPPGPRQLQAGRLNGSGSDGIFQLTALLGNSTFTATTGATAAPEPTSLTLPGLGVAGTTGVAWRRRK
jgi:hypothetical protein